ncbi:MAG TPA: hypothetical protein V6C58_06450, partial [Allocoleopsis sp.]
QRDTDFPKRMFIYNYRSFDSYGKPVISLAILGDEHKNWRPNSYSYGISESQVIMTFTIAKLLDYEEKWAELSQSKNPFAFVVMAHLKTKSTTQDMESREEWKWRIVRGLHEQGLSEELIINLFTVIDKMMTLPQEMQNSFDQKLNNYEEEKKMPLMSNIEEKALNRGIEQGTQKGSLVTRRNDVIRILKIRFGSDIQSVDESINQITDLSLLEQLLEQSVISNSITEFEQYLQPVKPE